LDEQETTTANSKNLLIGAIFALGTFLLEPVNVPIHSTDNETALLEKSSRPPKLT